MINIGAVIGWKFNNQSGMTTRDNKITEFPDGIPSQADQDLWATEYEAYVAANEYKGLRATAYPTLTEQADMAYWDRRNATTTLDDAITVVKNKYPKG
tara:strand:+ start:549 stop:842 length:294 start_codon:yes stop_codon:yes gene_type:complete